jgi:superfamily II RNA helicase
MTPIMQYDPFQKKAIDYINEGFSVIVAAPTGAGKTAIAEHVIQTSLERRQKVIYTAPIKALSNQKYRDFSKTYPDQVGILTGDVTINANAPTLIMTTEIFRNKILEEHSSLADYAWIIFDEMHYLDDWERGSAWEESLIFLPDHMNFLGLSATIPNVDELARWLSDIHHHPVKVVLEEKRPVPLHFFFQAQNIVYEDLNKLRKSAYHLPWGHISHGRVPRSVETKPNRVAALIKHLKENDCLPCIYFAFGRRRTEELAKEMLIYDLLTPEEKTKITELFDELCKKYEVNHDATAYDLRPLVERGIAFHHAGMLPTLKEVIEQLFTTRLIKIIFTTETFALGINMPARSVIFDELRKFYGFAFRPLKNRDFYQMAGRAGRRSIDKEGFVFLRVNPHQVAAEEINHMLNGEPEKVLSRFNASYATLLNLYAKYNEKLYDIYPLSFHYFQERKMMRNRALNYLHAKVQLLKELGHIRKNKLTEKGMFASKLYGYEILLAEFYVAGTLEKLSIVELAVLAVAIVYEPRKGIPKPKLSTLAKNLEKIANDIIFPLHKKEHSFHITNLSKACSFHLSPAIEGWMKNEPFEQILGYTEVDEGEVVRYFRMGLQILREIQDTPISDDLKQRIQKAAYIINRDVVDAEKQLRG